MEGPPNEHVDMEPASQVSSLRPSAFKSKEQRLVEIRSEVMALKDKGDADSYRQALSLSREVVKLREQIIKAEKEGRAKSKSSILLLWSATRNTM